MAKKPTFEDRLGRVEEIAETLEEGDLDLDDAVKSFEEARKLIAGLEEHLLKIEKRIELLTGDGDKQPFDSEDEEATD